MVKSAGVCSSWSGHPQPRIKRCLGWWCTSPPDHHRRFRLLCVFLSPLRVIIPLSSNSSCTAILHSSWHPSFASSSPMSVQDGNLSIKPLSLSIASASETSETRGSPNVESSSWYAFRNSPSASETYLCFRPPRAPSGKHFFLHRKTVSFPRGPTRRPAVPYRSWSFCQSRVSPDSLFFLL